MRAAIAAESIGIPSVSIVCEGFEGQLSPLQVTATTALRSP